MRGRLNVVERQNAANRRRRRRRAARVVGRRARGRTQSVWSFIGIRKQLPERQVGIILVEDIDRRARRAAIRGRRRPEVFVGLALRAADGAKKRIEAGCAFKIGVGTQVDGQRGTADIAVKCRAIRDHIARLQIGRARALRPDGVVGSVEARREEHLVAVVKALGVAQAAGGRHGFVSRGRTPQRRIRVIRDVEIHGSGGADVDIGLALGSADLFEVLLVAGDRGVFGEVECLGRIRTDIAIRLGAGRDYVAGCQLLRHARLIANGVGGGIVARLDKYLVAGI